MRRALREENPVLPFSPSRETGNHRLGAGQLSLRRERRRRDREIAVRSLLHSPLLTKARRDDRVEDCPHNAFRQRALAGANFTAEGRRFAADPYPGNTLAELAGA